jgi:hypothetical protein
MTRYGVRHNCCDLWSWDGAPLVDGETHEARKRAHDAFDTIWKDGRLSRSLAYKILAEKIGLHPKDCHIKLMSAETAGRVPTIAKQMLAEVR